MQIHIYIHLDVKCIININFVVGRYHHLTLPYRVSVTTMANDIFKPWYCCHEYVSFIDTT